ncbi:hypothetical protein L6164_012159 [Bauhinia variegata]|uniref:Uncharacterized protein n=1 Tax=Bauhinia variegata TaxID=167791 RepID=A0ACB9PAN3_BAUVA|nr:hypothetical protein L6164_012159 [Bauhinia variegata]
MDLNSEEEEIVLFDKNDLQDGIEECERSLVGKVITEWWINPITVETMMKTVWGSPGEFRVPAIEENKFSFFFRNERDMIQVVRGQLWMFKNCLLILKKWSEESEVNPNCFNCTPFWFQCWGCSNPLLNSGCGKKNYRKGGYSTRHRIIQHPTIEQKDREIQS